MVSSLFLYKKEPKMLRLQVINIMLSFLNERYDCLSGNAFFPSHKA